MDIKVYSRELSPLAILDSVNTLRMVRRYSSAGEFELRAPLTKSTAALLKRENLLVTSGAAWCIESVMMEMTAQGEFITVAGRDLKTYLSRRINWGILTYSGTAEDYMRKLVNDNCIVSGEIRAIPNLILGISNGFTEQIKKQNSYGNVLEVLGEISLDSGIGFDISLDQSTKQLIFNTWKGTDHTAASSQPIIISREFENVLEQNYLYSLNTYANTALVAGEGEGAARKTYTVSGDQTGLDRYEIYVDARDISSETENGVITEPEYNELLNQRGKEYLAECYAIETLDSVVKGSLSLGDIVTIRDKKWGLMLDSRVSEIETIFEAGNIQRNIIFGNNIPTKRS